MQPLLRFGHPVTETCNPYYALRPRGGNSASPTTVLGARRWAYFLEPLQRVRGPGPPKCNPYYVFGPLGDEPCDPYTVFKPSGLKNATLPSFSGPWGQQM